MFNVVNTQFKQFYDFALERSHAGKDTAIAKIGGKAEGTTLGERTIVVKTGDHIGKSRDQVSMDINNNTRALFKQTIIDMFGGEANIPKTVQKAMLNKDYGQGKPLTARRIIAVANAIKRLHIENAFEAPGTKPGEMALLAAASGYTRKDFAKLNAAANLYTKAFGVPLKEALERVMDKTTDAHAAMVAGKLYMKDAASFRRGVLAHANSAALGVANKTFVEAAVATEIPQYFAKIARNNAEQLRTWLNDPTELLDQNVAFEPGNHPFTELRKAVTDAIASYETLADQIENGQVAEKDARERLFSTQNVQKIAAEVRKLVLAFRELAAERPVLNDVATLLEALSTKLGMDLDELDQKFKVAFAEREAPRALEKISAANAAALEKTGKPLSIPKQITDGIKDYLWGLNYRGLDNIEKFCNVLGAQGDSALHFSDAQKDRLAKLLTDAVGAEGAQQALPRIIEELETAIFTEFLNGSADRGADVFRRTEMIVAHFEKNPGLLKVVNVGFDMTKADRVKAEIKAKVAAEFDALLKRKPDANNNNSQYVFNNDILPLGLREYSPGYVTFNGQNIPEGSKGKDYFGAMNGAQQGYAEFLVDKFPETHTKMRRFISVLCGMSVGVGGTIEAIFRDGGPEDVNILAGPSHNRAMTEYGALLLDRDRSDGENYDITIDENGDVILKMTHYSPTAIMQIFPDKGDPVTLTKLDKQAPIIAMGKITTTVKVTNVADADLEGSVPQFEVIEIAQEQI